MNEAPRVLFLVGAPGVGKTTLVRELFARLDPLGGRYLVDKPKWTVAPGICAAGHYKGEAFDGADTVPYNGVDAAIEYWARELAPKVPLTVLDGDRFSHKKAVALFEGHGALVRATFLTAPGEILREHRAARGSNQNPAWMRGRETKARRFAERNWPTPPVRLEVTQPAPKLADELLTQLEGW